MNFLEVLVNDEEAMLVELNRLCRVKNNIFSKAKKKINQSSPPTMGKNGDACVKMEHRHKGILEVMSIQLDPRY
jgi:hypothetical protein